MYQERKAVIQGQLTKIAVGVYRLTLSVSKKSLGFTSGLRQLLTCKPGQTQPARHTVEVLTAGHCKFSHTLWRESKAGCLFMKPTIP
jgi:hypothetical protein